jgi:hypothetical protein
VTYPGAMPPASPPRPRLLVASSGKGSERVTAVPITTAPGRSPAVAMSLGPHGRNRTCRLPDLRPGDRLVVTAECEVTTDTAARGVTNVGRPYAFGPLVQAQLLLAARPEETAPRKGRALRIGKLKRQRVTQLSHHHVVAFGEVGFTVPRQGLPWEAAATCLNLVLSASHPNAHRGNVLIVGENEPDGTVGADKGRLNAIRLRPGGQPARGAVPSRRPLVETIPVDKTKKTVVFSQRMSGLQKGEQLSVRCALETSAAHLGYPARISTRIFLADSRAQTETGGRAQKVGSEGGELCENNGFNCAGKGTCTTRRAGVLRIEDDAGSNLYLNVVAVSGDPHRHGKPGDSLRVVSGLLERVRYPAELRG